MSSRDELLHDLGDRLNGIAISVELAIRLLEQRDTAEAADILVRIREDCSACGSIMADLRDDPGN